MQIVIVVVGQENKHLNNKYWSLFMRKEQFNKLNVFYSKQLRLGSTQLRPVIYLHAQRNDVICHFVYFL